MHGVWRSRGLVGERWGIFPALDSVHCHALGREDLGAEEDGSSPAFLSRAPSSPQSPVTQLCVHTKKSSVVLWPLVPASKSQCKPCSKGLPLTQGNCADMSLFSSCGNIWGYKETSFLPFFVHAGVFVFVILKGKLF